MLDTAKSAVAPMQAAVVGGKGAQLGMLAALGLRVPPWFCVTARSCEEVRRSGKLTPEDEQALLAAFDATFGEEGRVAVRSSAEVEDSERDSFAGQLETFLNVPRAEVVRRVIDCIRSADSERVRRYREARGVEGGARMAVIVQRMIEPRASGVLFTANPSTGAVGEVVIAAGLGLGEGVVASRVECDTFYADLETGEVRRRELSQKRSRIAPAAGGGTHVEIVPATVASAPALGDAELRELVAVGRRVHEARGRPQDIEWAIDASGRIHVLQARAITALPGAEGRETLLDNANVVESYPGVSSPLTFSFVRTAYERTFREAASRFGIPADRVRDNADAFENLVAYVDGRVYYNALNWYRLYQLVPGFEGALPAWERALGLEPRAVRRARAGGLRSAAVKAKVAARIVRQLAALPSELERFSSSMAEVLAPERARDLPSLDAHALLDRLDELGRSIYGPFALALVNDFYAQQLYSLVGRLAARWELGDPAALSNALFAGERELESIAPARALMRIAREIRAESMWRELFLSELSDAEVLARLRSDVRHAGARSMLDEYVARFGDRTLSELKLETPSLEDDPRFAIAMLRNYVRSPLRPRGAVDLALRAAAEAKVQAALAGHPLRRAIFLRVLSWARRSVRYRESMRLARSRAYGLAKRIYRALGERLTHASVLERWDDVFLLTTEEVAGAVRGHGVTRELRTLVALRRLELDESTHLDPPGRLTTRGIVAARSTAQAAEPEQGSSGELRGTPCSAGRAIAKAKVILDPRDDLRICGEILVAPMTDPGWVFLMMSAAGIVSERGTILSHTAIIGRELGIPTVVGVKDATRLICSGDEVELDASAGTVSVRRAAAPAQERLT